MSDLIAFCKHGRTVGWSLGRVPREETDTFIQIARRLGYTVRVASSEEIRVSSVNHECGERAGVDANG